MPAERWRLLRLLEVLYGPGRRDVARSLGFGAAADADRVRRWYKEGREPSGDDLMRVLRTVGLLQPEAVAVWDGVSLAEARRRVDARRRPDVLQAAVGEVLEEASGL